MTEPTKNSQKPATKKSITEQIIEVSIKLSALELREAKDKLEAANERHKAEMLSIRKACIVGEIVLGWVNDSRKKMPYERIQEYVDKYLPSDSVDRELFDLPVNNKTE
jgi:chromosome condensin MukBEF complex kleisin-like MukF subunit